MFYFYRWKNVVIHLLIFFGAYHVLDILSPQSQLTTLEEGTKKRHFVIRVLVQLYVILFCLRPSWESIADIHTVFIALGLFEYVIELFKTQKELIYLACITLFHGLIPYDQTNVLQILVCMQVVESIGDLLFSCTNKFFPKWKNKIRRFTTICSLLVQGIMCTYLIYTQKTDWTCAIYMCSVPYLASKEIDLLLK